MAKDSKEQEREQELDDAVEGFDLDSMYDDMDEATMDRLIDTTEAAEDQEEEESEEDQEDEASS
jgi:hypothetical protein